MEQFFSKKNLRWLELEDIMGRYTNVKCQSPCLPQAGKVQMKSKGKMTKFIKKIFDMGSFRHSLDI